MTELRFPRPAKRTPKQKQRIKSRGRKRTTNKRKEYLSLKKQCNILWSRWIRRNECCEFLGVGGHRQCGGNLQAMHGFGKKAYPGVRFAAWNGFCGCGAIHTYYTWRPPEWENYLRSRWGEELYQQRLRDAMQTTKYDLTQVAATYRAALAGVEL